MSSFPAYIAQEIENGTSVQEYTPDGTDIPVTGDLVFYDVSTATVKRCGANPALIAGISEVNTTPGFRPNSAQSLTPDGKVPIRTTTSRAIWAFSCATTLTEANVGEDYGVTRDGTTGFWQIDLSKSGSNQRFRIVRIDAVNQIAYAVLLSANAQFGGI